MTTLPAKYANIDSAQVFLVYMSTVGDVSKTALKCDLDPNVVRELAEHFQWTEKIKRVSLLSKTGRPDDYAKAVNRALNFAQAHMMRSLVQNVLDHLAKMESSELLDTLTTTDNKGRITYSAKFLSDLAAASEKAHHLSYLALADEVANRGNGESEKEAGISNAALHASVLNALSHPAAAGAELKMIEGSIEDLVNKNITPRKPE